MSKSKICTVIIIALFLLVAISSANLTLGEETDSEAPTWEEGYSWKYKPSSTEENGTHHLYMNVTDTGVEVNGYECYELAVGVNGSTIENRYISEENLSMVTTVHLFNESREDDDESIVYEPPVKNYDFPLEVGKSWEQKITRKTKYREGNFTLKFECTGKETVSTEAGEFETFVINRNETYKRAIGTNESTERRTYFSREAKNWVKLEILDSPAAEIEGEIRLVDYDLSGKEDSGLLPSYHVGTVLIICAMTTIIINYKNR